MIWVHRKFLFYFPSVGHVSALNWDEAKLETGSKVKTIPSIWAEKVEPFHSIRSPNRPLRLCGPPSSTFHHTKNRALQPDEKLCASLLHRSLLQLAAFLCWPCWVGVAPRYWQGFGRMQVYSYRGRKGESATRNNKSIFYTMYGGVFGSWGAKWFL
jgi:hypothetical protein